MWANARDLNYGLGVALSGRLRKRSISGCFGVGVALVGCTGACGHAPFTGNAPLVPPHPRHCFRHGKYPMDPVIPELVRTLYTGSRLVDRPRHPPC